MPIVKSTTQLLHLTLRITEKEGAEKLSVPEELEVCWEFVCPTGVTQEISPTWLPNMNGTRIPPIDMLMQKAQSILQRITDN